MAPIAKLRIAALILFIAFHIFYITWRVAPFQFVKISGPITPYWDSYGILTGGSSGYSFFAPAVASQMMVTTSWTDDTGKVRSELHQGTRNEAELRLAAMSLALVQLHTINLPARAIAVDTFNRHPEARQVAVTVGLYAIPTMAEYRRGIKPHTMDINRDVFIRRSDLEEGNEPAP